MGPSGPWRHGVLCYGESLCCEVRRWFCSDETVRSWLLFDLLGSGLGTRFQQEVRQRANVLSPRRVALRWNMERFARRPEILCYLKDDQSDFLKERRCTPYCSASPLSCCIA